MHWIDRKRRPKCIDGLLPPGKLREGVTQVVVAGGKRRRELRRNAILGDGLFELPLLAKSIAQVEMRSHVHGIKFDCATKRQRAVQLGGFVEEPGADLFEVTQKPGCRMPAVFVGQCLPFPGE